MSADSATDLNVSLSSLALLSLRMGEGKDYLDYLHGFVVEALHHIGAPTFDSVRIQEVIKKDFGLRIPAATIAIYLKRLQKEKLITPTADGHQFRILDLPPTDIAADREATRGRINQVIASLKDFAAARYGRNWSDDETASVLTDFVREYSIDFVRFSEFRSPLPEPSAGTAGEHFVIASFIRHCVEAAPGIFESIKTLVESHILANALLCEDLRDKGTGFRNVTFVLDTRLLLKAFDLEAPIDTENTRTLFQTIRRLKGVLCVFPETKDEIHSVLQGIIRGFQRGGARGAVVDELRKRGRGVADVILADAKLDENLKALGVTTFQAPAYDQKTYRFQIDEEALRAELEEELGYALGRAADHDVHVVRSIFALRKGRRISRIEDCGFVFLTTNAALSRAAFHQQRNETTGWVFSAVITDYHLSHLAWLKSPLEAGDLARTEILSSCHAAMRPPQQTWRKYISEVDRLKAEGRVSVQDHEVLRLSLNAPEELMEVTNGEVEGITEGNVRLILDRLEKSYAAEKEVQISNLRAEQERIAAELANIQESAEARERHLSEAAEKERLELTREIERLKLVEVELLKKRAEEQRSRVEVEVPRPANASETNPPAGSPIEQNKRHSRARKHEDGPNNEPWVLPTTLGSGFVFLVTLIMLAVLFPEPKPFQEFVFRVVLALAASGVGAALPGFLTVKMPLWAKGTISASGALALFVIVYRVNPPALLKAEASGSSSTKAEEKRPN